MKSSSAAGHTFTFRQDGWYRSPYVIEMGWNVNSKKEIPYAASAQVTLADGSKMTVYLNKETKKYAADKKALAAAGALISDLKKTEKYPQIKTPYIVRMDYVPSADIPAAAEKYYKNEDLLGFSTLFQYLDKNTQKAYGKKSYNAEQIAFFSVMVEHMDQELLRSYAKKAQKDGSVDFFSLVIEYLPKEDLKQYIRTAYKSGDIACFAILTDYMTGKEMRDWKKRAKKDGRIDFYHMLGEK